MSEVIELNTGFASFALYQAVHLHFISPYDYFLYNGKTTITKDGFAKRKDRFTFHKLARKYNIHDMRNFFVANMLEKADRWTHEFIEPDAEDCYKNWQKRNQSLTYIFEQNVEKLMDLVDTPKQLLEVKTGNFPILLTQFLQNEICIETLVIMNDILGFFKSWDKKIDDDIFWPDIKLKCEKYTPFLRYDEDKFRNILKEKTKKYAQA